MLLVGHYALRWSTTRNHERGKKWPDTETIIRHGIVQKSGKTMELSSITNYIIFSLPSPTTVLVLWIGSYSYRLNCAFLQYLHLLSLHSCLQLLVGKRRFHRFCFRTFRCRSLRRWNSFCIASCYLSFPPLSLLQIFFSPWMILCTCNQECFIPRG